MCGPSSRSGRLGGATLEALHLRSVALQAAVSKSIDTCVDVCAAMADRHVRSTAGDSQATVGDPNGNGGTEHDECNDHSDEYNIHHGSHCKRC